MSIIEPDWYFPCTPCGTQCPCPVEIVKRYPGQRVTRRCPSCGQFFDVELPPKDTGSG